MLCEKYYLLQLWPDSGLKCDCFKNRINQKVVYMSQSIQIPETLKITGRLFHKGFF